MTVTKAIKIIDWRIGHKKTSIQDLQKQSFDVDNDYGVGVNPNSNY